MAKQELRKNLVLVAVDFEDNQEKAVLTFLDEERGEVRTVNFNRQVYKDGKYVDDADKAAKVDGWCDEYMHSTFDGLGDCIGSRHDVYEYDTFNSLFPVDIVEKFTKDQVGQIYQTKIDEIIVDDYFIRIRYTIDGKRYESKQTFGTYVENMKSWFLDPQRKEKEFEKFKNKYHVPVSEKDKLIGHQIMVEVKAAYGKFYYGDIKKFPGK